MPADDPADVDTVLVEPEYCHRCGSALESGTFEGTAVPWCPDCDLAFTRKPVPVVQALVHDDDSVLMLDEPIPQAEGVWTFPGGHVTHDEGPRASLVRELREETGLSAAADDLDFLTIYHNEIPDRSFYLITYAIEYGETTGEIRTEGEEFVAQFRSVATIRSSDRVRDSDRERAERLLGER